MNREILWRQLSAATQMLENAIRACPDELWRRPSSQMGFWYLAYHTLFVLDEDMTPAGQPFTSPSFDVHEYQMLDKEPPYHDPYSKDEILAYLSQCRDRCRALVASLPPGDRSLYGCRRIDADTDELVVYHIRHVQHHAAQLNLLLRQNTDDAPRWVRKAD